MLPGVSSEVEIIVGNGVGGGSNASVGGGVGGGEGGKQSGSHISGQDSELTGNRQLSGVVAATVSQANVGSLSQSPRHSFLHTAGQFSTAASIALQLVDESSSTSAQLKTGLLVQGSRVGRGVG